MTTTQTKRTTTKKKLVKLPGSNVIHLDPSTITCVRTESNGDVWIAIVHTTAGYAVGTTPEQDQSIGELVNQILALVK